jgi:hypothetical protein
MMRSDFQSSMVIFPFQPPSNTLSF